MHSLNTIEYLNKQSEIREEKKFQKEYRLRKRNARQLIAGYGLLSLVVPCCKLFSIFSILMLICSITMQHYCSLTIQPYCQTSGGGKEQYNMKIEELISDNSRMGKINSTLKDKILRRNKQIKELRHNIWELRKQNMMFVSSLRKQADKLLDRIDQ